MRTVSNLLTLADKVFVHFAGENVFRLFLKNAEAEGFTFSDGTKPTEANLRDIISVHTDWTIGYIGGWASHVFDHQTKSEIGGRFVKVDYGKYMSGRDDYVL